MKKEIKMASLGSQGVKKSLSLMIIIAGIIMLFSTMSVLAEKKSYEEVIQGDCANLWQTCGNCTNLQIINVLDENNNLITSNVPVSTLDNFYWNGTFCQTNNTGIATVNWQGDPNGESWTPPVDLPITPNGSGLTGGVAALLIFFLTVTFIILWLGIVGINKAVKGEWQIFYVCLTYVSLFCLFFLLWIISKNYLYDLQFLESLFWIVWLVLSILFFPFVIFVSLYIMKKQSEKLLVEDYQKQGYSKEEAQELSKSHKR